MTMMRVVLIIMMMMNVYIRHKIYFLCYNEDAREDCKSAQSRLLEADGRISAAELALEESRRRETGRHGRWQRHLERVTIACL